MNDIDKKKALMIEALRKSLGIVETACEESGVKRTDHEKWLDDDFEYKNEVDLINKTAIDFVESKLYKLINDGDTTAIIFYLKTKGKERGYIINDKKEKGNQNPFTTAKKPALKAVR